jgi:SET domain-containing protein
MPFCLVGMQVQQRVQGTYYKFNTSRIHGRGLFAAREIPKDAFIIEYVGVLVPSILQDKLEKKYRDRGSQSTYLFTLDDHTVIDATEKVRFQDLLLWVALPLLFVWS